MVNLDESKPDEDINDYGGWMSLCCPRCKSKDVEIKKSKEGYFWVYLCNNCRYMGKEGDTTGCLKKDSDTKTDYD